MLLNSSLKYTTDTISISAISNCRYWIHVMKTLFTYQMYIIDNSSGELVRLLLPEDAEVNFYWDSILVRTRSSWKSSRTTYPPDSLLAAKLSDVIQKSKMSK